jgi:hypothetical protein
MSEVLRLTEVGALKLILVPSALTLSMCPTSLVSLALKLKWKTNLRLLMMETLRPAAVVQIRLTAATFALCLNMAVVLRLPVRVVLSSSVMQAKQGCDA